MRGLSKLAMIFIGIVLIFGGIFLMTKPYVDNFIQSITSDKAVEKYQSEHKADKDNKKEKKTPQIPKDKDKIAGTIEVPDAKIKEPIYPGDATPEQLNKGISFAEEDESMDDQNISIAGHTSNIQKDFQFTSLDKAKEGSKVYLTVDGEKRTYKMTDIRNVKPNEGDVMDEKKGKKDRITLITCDNYNEETGELEDRQIFVAEEA